MTSADTNIMLAMPVSPVVPPNGRYSGHSRHSKSSRSPRLVVDVAGIWWRECVVSVVSCGRQQQVPRHVADVAAIWWMRFAGIAEVHKTDLHSFEKERQNLVLLQE